MNALIEVIPPKARRIVYGAAALILLVVGAWQASDGNWLAALISVATSAVNGLAHANTGTSSGAEDDEP